MAAPYGSLIVGALGVSHRLGGCATTPPQGVQEAESTLISQNVGACNKKRAISFFFKTALVIMTMGVFFLILMFNCKEILINLFAKGNKDFAFEISKIYHYEIWGSIFLAAGTTIQGMLYGFGFTRLAMILNIIRLFGYRIPTLWYIQNMTNLGSEGVGLTMFISNALYGITTIITSIFVTRKLIREIKTSTVAH
jgi:Na+-driven multidrug efflux pump